MVVIDFIKPCKFGHVDRYPDGRCRTCKIANARQWSLNNKEKRKVICSIYRKNNPSQVKDWVESNREKKRGHNRKWNQVNIEKLKQIKRNWQLNNQDRINALGAKRRAQQLRATPIWLTQDDLVKINLIYKESARLSKESGISYEVDHEFPLQGKLVSGLHVPNNLRIITAIENQRKGNKHVR